MQQFQPAPPRLGATARTQPQLQPGDFAHKQATNERGRVPPGHSNEITGAECSPFIDPHSAGPAQGGGT